MHRHFRKIAWLAVASAVVMSLTIGAILAHEGRPVGDYRLVVGWLEEPAYEGSQNAVSIKVNKIVEAEAGPTEGGPAAGGSGDSSHGTPGHHDEDPEATPNMSHGQQESGESDDHHGTGDSDGDGSDETDDHHGTEDSDGGGTGKSDDHHATEDSDDDGSGESDDHHATEDSDYDGTGKSDDHHATEDTDGDGSGESDDHHGTEDTDGDGSGKSDDHHSTEDTGGDGSGESDDHHGTEDTDGDSHGEDGHHDSAVEAGSPISVSVEATADSVSGLNVHIQTQGFAFNPENVNGDHLDGEGHAHVYVDGIKISRVYTPWFYLCEVEPGEHEIRVTLNANSHGEYSYNGAGVDATTHISVPEAHGHTHAPDTVEADSRIAVNLTVEQDPTGGGNLFIGTEGFTFAPQSAGGNHIAGEGHADVYVNGVKIGRLYGHALQLGNLAAGQNKVRVTLNANDHSAYTINGEAVEAIAVIDIAEGMGGSSYGDAPPNGDNIGTSRSIVPHGGGKPLASIAGQDGGVAVPVEGLEGSLQVEVTHLPSGVSRTFDLEAAWGEPGHYVAGLIPTASGVYEFRFFGTIEGTAVDETFVSQGGGGDFNDIQSSGEIQFPVQLPEIREIESGARGALSTAQEAQGAAIAAQAAADEAQGGGSTLAIVALIIGIVGVVAGGGGLYIALRGRNSQ